MVRNRRNNRRRRRNTSRRPRHSSLLTNSPTGVKIQSTRSLTCAPRVIDKTSGKLTPSWVETALPYLTIVMKFVGMLLASPSPLPHLSEKKVVVSSIIQSVLIGAEDIIYDHPITEPFKIDATETDIPKECMKIDYSLARLHSIKVVVSFMGKVSERAGRLAAVLIPLNYEKAVMLNDREGLSGEVVDFKQLTQKPGAVVSPNLRPLTLFHKTRGFTARLAQLGSTDPTYFDSKSKRVYLKGGIPLYELIVGYQDLAAVSSDPKLAYDLSEAALCIEISGDVTLDAPVAQPRYMRSPVRTLFSVNDVSAYTPGERAPVSIPHEDLVLYDGTLRVLADSASVDALVEDFVQMTG